MRLDPGDQLTRVNARQAVILGGSRGDLLLFQRHAQVVAVALGGDLHQLGVVGSSVGAEKDLAVLELRVVIEHDRPEVAGIRSVVVGQLDMLHRVKAEAVDAVGEHPADIVDEELLHLGVLGVEVPQSRQVTLRDLLAVGPVLDLEDLVEGGIARDILDIRGDRGIIGGAVVGDDVGDDLHAVLVRLFDHLDELLLGAEHVVADGVVDRLILIPPVAVVIVGAFQRGFFGLRLLEFVDRRGLNGLEACGGDLRDVLLDGVEAPAPTMQDRAVLHLFGKTVGIRRSGFPGLCGVDSGGEGDGAECHHGGKRQR